MPGSCNLANIMLCTDLILAILPLLLYLSHLSHAMILEVIQSTHTANSYKICSELSTAFATAATYLHWQPWVQLDVHT